MSRLSLRLTVALLLATFFAYLAALPVSVRAGTFPVPDGTEVHFTLMQDLKSGGDKAGEVVSFQVSQDVYSPSRELLIAADTPAYGKVTQSNRRGMFGQGGKLKYTIDYILMPDKTHVLLRADPQLARGGDNRTATIATAILLTPLTLFINGKDVSVKKGQQYIMYVDAASHSTPAAPAPAPPVIQAAPAPVAAAPVSAWQSLFTFANGSQTVGTMLGFDGSTYTVSTPKGMRQFKKAWITSIRALSPVTAPTAQR